MWIICRFDGNDQCHLMYGEDWTVYSRGVVNQESVNICRAIWCRRHYNLRSPNAAALQVDISTVPTSIKL